MVTFEYFTRHIRPEKNNNTKGKAQRNFHSLPHATDFCLQIRTVNTGCCLLLTVSPVLSTVTANLLYHLSDSLGMARTLSHLDTTSKHEKHALQTTQNHSILLTLWAGKDSPV